MLPVQQEYSEKGFTGRFGAGLPKASDGSMLFLQNLISKLEKPENGGGRGAIVLSGSPLFNGGAGSGESEIRRFILENDYLEAIVALPTDIFFRTGIGTYIWLISNRKPEQRKGKVQLIDATGMGSSMRKNEGNKRKFIDQNSIDEITVFMPTLKKAQSVRFLTIPTLATAE
jgi:type I restriction enzyme M protein